MRFGLLILVALLCASPMTALPADDTDVRRGTLVVITPTRDGWSVCADKRVTGRKGAYDDIQKLDSIGGKVVFSGSGAISGTTAGVRQGSYDAFKSVREVTDGRPFEPTKTYWQQIMRRLSDDVNTFYAASRANGTASPAVNGALLFQLAFVWSEAGLTRKWAIVRAYMSAPYAVNNVRYETFTAPDTSASFVLGKGELFQELDKGQNQAFDKLRRTKELEGFIGTKKRPLTTVTETDAERFGRTLIALTNMRGTLPEGTQQALVGPVADCALVRADKIVWNLYKAPRRQ
jgi:hypothetical protein